MHTLDKIGNTTGITIYGVMIMVIQRGDVYYADLRPVVGSEQGGVRPVLIIQNNVGDVKVSSSKDLSGYAYDLDTSIGDVSINGVSHKKEYQQKGSDGKITVDNSTGDISITY